MRFEGNIRTQLLYKIDNLLSILVDIRLNGTTDIGHLCNWGRFNHSDFLRVYIETLANCDTCSGDSLLYDLKYNDLWPIAATNSKMLGRMLFNLENTQSSGALCNNCEFMLNKILKAYADLARSLFPGLCLDCVKYNNEEPFTLGLCRWDHSHIAPVYGAFRS